MSDNMLDILKNFDSAEKGESTSTQDTGGMKAILESFNAVSEAPVPAIPSQMPPAAMPPQEPQGQPVTMNVSLNASGKDHVDDLLSLMQAAGLSGAKQLDKGDGILDVDMDGDHQPDLDINSDMSKLRSIIADPKEESIDEDDGWEPATDATEFGSFDDDHPMPSILKHDKQTDVTKALRAAAGLPDDAPVYFDDADLVYGDKTVWSRCGIDDDCTFGDAVEALIDFAKNNPVEKESSENVEINSIRKNAGLDVQEEAEDTATLVAQELKKMGVSDDASNDEIEKNIGAALKSLDLKSVLNMMNMSKDYRYDVIDGILNKFRGMSEWANSPQGSEGDEEYKDAKYMYKDLSGGLNREKKQFAKAQDGDNAMAVESIKSQLWAALNEKKKSKKGDGNLANNYPPYDKVTRGDIIAGATGKDQKGGKKKK